MDERGPIASTLKGSVQFKESFSFRTLLSTPSRDPCQGSEGGIIDHTCIVWATEEDIGEGGVLAIDSIDTYRVLFLHEFVSALLTFMDKVALGELVVIEALMSATL